MRYKFEIFAITVLYVLIISALYNTNKLLDYRLFSNDINELLFGLSYTVPFNIFGIILLKESVKKWHVVVSKTFLWLTISALADELFFNPFEPEFYEHITAIIIVLSLTYCDRIRKLLFKQNE